MVLYEVSVQGGVLPTHTQIVQCASVGEAEALAVHLAADVMRELDSGRAPHLQVRVCDKSGNVLVLIEADVHRTPRQRARQEFAEAVRQLRQSR